MAVKEILDDRVIDLNMNAKNKDEVIRHLAGLLKNAGYIENLEGYVRDVYVRESEGITGIGGHVAIPHGKSDHVDRVGIAVGRTRDMSDRRKMFGAGYVDFLLIDLCRQFKTAYLRTVFVCSGQIEMSVCRN